MMIVLEGRELDDFPKANQTAEVFVRRFHQRPDSSEN